VSACSQMVDAPHDPKELISLWKDRDVCWVYNRMGAANISYLLVMVWFSMNGLDDG